jgi:exonuclease I
MTIQNIYHDDGTITVWHVYRQQWTRGYAMDLAGDHRLMASLSAEERAAIFEHSAKHQNGNDVIPMEALYLNAAPIAWQGMASELEPEEMGILARRMEAHAATAAFLSAYLSAREGGKDHDGAVRSGNIARRSTRKSLGYVVTNDLTI